MPFPNPATQFKSGAKQVELARKAGRMSAGPRKRYAAQLREYKRAGDTNKQIAWFVKRLEDPEANILHIQKLVDQFLEEIKGKPMAEIKGIDTLITLHKAHFGEKRITKNLNINIDMDVEVEELDRHIKDVIGDKG